MKQITHREWYDQGVSLFGIDINLWRFKCCNCGHVQTIQHFIDAKIPDPETKVMFSCIGRWTNGPGTLGDKKKPCNYTLGGLFKIHTLEVVTSDGRARGVFEFEKP